MPPAGPVTRKASTANLRWWRA